MNETKKNQEYEQRMYWLHATSPLHVGAGRGIGFVDLPITREKVTNWPYIPGSAVKGVLADHHGVTEDSRTKNDSWHKLAFGRADLEGEAPNSGSLVFTDALLVCLPVRSLYGTFAWCTSPIALERLKRDFTHAAKLSPLTIPSPASGTLQVHVTSDPSSVLADQEHVFFEDLDFVGVPCANADRWAKALGKSIFADETWQKLFAERFVVVPDDVFNFLCETATQVDARVKIDDNTKTVAVGQLWYEESLPAETILAGIVWCGPVFGQQNRQGGVSQIDLLNKFASDACNLQIGGKATVGRGRVRMSFGQAEIEQADTGVKQEGDS
jgi:CRISPR-associated protein Cmr4